MAKKKLDTVEKIDPLEKSKVDNFFKICQSEEELRAWFSVYFGLRFPSDTIDPDSTSNPIHAAYTIYCAVRDNTGDVTPGFIMLSARSSYKTLVAAAIETVILFHFRLTIAHMAAIKDQSDKAIEYVSSFVLKTQRYWEAHGWEKISDNKKKTTFLTPEKEQPYLVVIIATMAGANSEHTNMLCVSGGTDIVVKTDFFKKNTGPISSGGVSITAARLYREITSGKKVQALTFNHKKAMLEFKEITAAYRSKKEMLQLGFAGGKTLKVSRDHPIFVKEKDDYIPAGDLEVGNTLQSIKKGALYEDTLTSIDADRVRVAYDFTVADNHNFFANTFLVHNCVDELDVIRDSRAYDEAILGIPSQFGDRYPITVKLSTRKFAFGLMEAQINRAKESGERILRWNVLDNAKRCTPDIHGDRSIVHDRYVANELPLRQISPEDFEKIPDNKKHEWSHTKAFPGCLTCPLLPVCKTRLADKDPISLQGGKNLYKPIKALIGDFKRAPSPDIASAQLLCWRPSTKGLVYPRFVDNTALPYEETNTITMEAAYEKLIGDVPRGPVTHKMLMDEIVALNLPTYTGLDWGFTKEFAFQVYCHMPWGDVWVLDTFGAPELELSDQIEHSLKFQEKYNISTWWVDQAYPQHKKTFNKQGMKSPDFTKDVMGGIEAFRGLIVDTMGKRKLKILIANPEIEEDKQGNGNLKLVQALKVHHFKLDAAGNITKAPDDGEFADQCFVPGTKITTIDGMKNIEDISCSDLVLTHTGRYQRVLNTMVSIFSGEVLTVWNPISSVSVTCTTNHPFLTESGKFIPAKNLGGFNHAILASHAFRPVSVTLEKTAYVGPVFNLEVEEDHSYVANGYAVHNCDAARYYAQNMHGAKGKVAIGRDKKPAPPPKPRKNSFDTDYSGQMQDVVKKVTEPNNAPKRPKKKGGMSWNY